MNDTQKAPVSKTNIFFKSGCISLLAYLVVGLVFTVLATVVIMLVFNGKGVSKLTLSLLRNAALFVTGGFVGIFMQKFAMKRLNLNSIPWTNSGVFVSGAFTYTLIAIPVVLALLLPVVPLIILYKNPPVVEIMIGIFCYVSTVFLTGGFTGLRIWKKYLKLLNNESQGGVSHE